MYKSFLIAFFLVLFCHSDRIFGQAASDNQKTHTASTPTAKAASTQPDSEAKGLYEEGLKRVQEGQVSEALYRFQRAVEIDPEYADAYSALGRAYFKLRQWQNAIYNLRRATALKEEGSEVRSRGSKVRSQGSGVKQAVQEGRSQGVEPDAPDAEPLSGPSETKPQQQTDKKAELSLPSADVPAHADRTTPGSTSVAILKSDRAAESSTSAERIKLQETNGNVAERRHGTPANITPSSSETEQQIVELATKTAPAKNRVETTPTSSMQPAARQQVGVKPLPINLETLNLEVSVGLESKYEQVEARVLMDALPPPGAVETKSVGFVSPTSSSDDVSLTQIYRVGPGDILDVRVNESESRQSTLFTVTSSGLLEHPLLVEPLPVSGLTVEEIGAKIENDLSSRALIVNPNVMVGVRDYASHPILVTGLVQSSGTKFLRREAIPLYVVVADAQPLPQAARVTVVRNEPNQILEIDLTQTAEMSFLVHPGDVITVKPNVTQFIYIAGEVKFPGEKTLHRGLTLMQAIIKAGGATRRSKVAEISRDDGRGFLVGTRFVLKDIESGKASDPLLQPGDRIMILR
ncbi:MAG TPA: polysaccharide biosynthesis/export family protein [Pyrinomonadaceae bacterium]|nr:polysaccharide biosynthesis/export family protein [Pyrinomonadaceae bacterium]